MCPMHKSPRGGRIPPGRLSDCRLQRAVGATMQVLLRHSANALSVCPDVPRKVAAMAWSGRVLALSLLCLYASACSQSQDLPEVDVGALTEQVNTLAGQLRTEAQRLIDKEGAEKALEQLRGEAEADETIAFERLNLAAVVAALSGDGEAAGDLLGEEMPAARERDLPLAIARHVVVSEAGDEELHDASLLDLTLKQVVKPSPKAIPRRHAIVFAGLTATAPEPTDAAVSLDAMGRLHAVKREWAAAREYFERSLALKEKLEAGPEDVARALERLGSVCADANDLDPALDYRRRALAIREEHSADSLDVATALNSLGLLHFDRSEYPESIDCHERALAIRLREKPGSIEVAHSLNNIGNGHLFMEAYGEALASYEECLGIKEGLDPGSLAVASTLANIGTLYSEWGKFEEAIDYTERALEIRERLAPDSLAVAKSLNTLGSIWADRGDLDKATEHFKRSVAIKQKLAPGSLLAASGLGNLANILTRRGKLTEALESYEQLLGLFRSAIPGSEAVAITLDGMGVVYSHLGQLDRALECHTESLRIREELGPDSSRSAASLQNLGTVYVELERFDEARDAFERGLAILAKVAPDSMAVAAILGNLAVLDKTQGDYDSALASLQRSLELTERIAPDSVSVASTLLNIASAHRRLGDFDAALECLGESLRIYERDAPGSLKVATVLHNTGNVHATRQELEPALRYFERCLEIEQKVVPDSSRVGETLDRIGSIHYRRGDLARALDYYERGLEMISSAAPGTLAEAGVLNDLGLLHSDRGDLDRALICLQQALEIKMKLAPDAPGTAGTMSNIGLLHADRGDYVGALAWHQRALEIEQRSVPGTLTVAHSLHNMGGAYLQQGAVDQAIECYRQALEIKSQVAPDSLTMATTLDTMGVAHTAAERFDEATLCYEQAIRIERKQSPGSLCLASTLSNLADLHCDLGRLDRAMELEKRALAIKQHLAPGSATVAKSQCGLGMVYEARGALEEARAVYEEAVDTVEKARERSGYTDEGRGRFLSANLLAYRDLIRVLVNLDDPEGAADTAERMRARSLLEMVAEPTVDAVALAPELAEHKTRLEARQNQLHSKLRGLDGEAPDPGEAEKITAELQGIALEQEALTAEIRGRDPRYAAMQYPAPMTVDQLSEGLAAGTLVLLYVVDGQVVRLFTFGPGMELQAHEVQRSRDELETDVRSLLDAVAERADTEPASRQLAALLLDQAADALAGAERVLILPDGPLWLVPFHALPLGGDTPLCERLPVCYAPSGTVLLEGRALRQGVAAGSGLLALGDPDFSAAAANGERGAYIPLRGAEGPPEEGAQQAPAFQRLPYSGLEVSVVAGTFGDDARVRLGMLATERTLRREVAGSRVLHLATHGFLDPGHPTDSALVLTSPRNIGAEHEDDGFLKAWEVFGLDLAGCDLVTLSACETAKGEVLSGEGVIGLTRAFMYAGAASVLCTQWKVADDSTAALMVRFYTHYRDGDNKDIALRKAMREIRTGKTGGGEALKLPEELGDWNPNWSHPYFWAPFILMGEYLQT